jgi:hypothetical protein
MFLELLIQIVQWSRTKLVLVHKNNNFHFERSIVLETDGIRVQAHELKRTGPPLYTRSGPSRELVQPMHPLIRGARGPRLTAGDPELTRKHSGSKPRREGSPWPSVLGRWANKRGKRSPPRSWPSSRSESVTVASQDWPRLLTALDWQSSMVGPARARSVSAYKCTWTNRGSLIYYCQ